MLMEGFAGEFPSKFSVKIGSGCMGNRITVQNFVGKFACDLELGSWL